MLLCIVSMLSVVFEGDVYVRDIILSIIMLSAVMLCVAMLNVEGSSSVVELSTHYPEF
jgi:hypothetical protein